MDKAKSNKERTEEVFCTRAGHSIPDLNIIESENGRYGRIDKLLYSLVPTEIERFGKNIVVAVDTTKRVDVATQADEVSGCSVVVEKGQTLYAESFGSFTADRRVTLRPYRFYIFGHSVYYATERNGGMGEPFISLLWCGTDETLPAEEVNERKHKYMLKFMESPYHTFIESSELLNKGDVLLFENPRARALKGASFLGTGQRVILHVEVTGDQVVAVSLVPESIVEKMKLDELKRIEEMIIE